jgi:hypothetical protein
MKKAQRRMENSMQLMQTIGTAQAVGGNDLELSLGDELRVPKREVVADITFLFAPKSSQACVFFLSYYSPQRHGEESLGEYLDSMDSFLPLRDKASGEFFIVHVDQIMMVRETQALEMNAGRPLRLVLQNGRELALSTSEPRHAWRARPIDLLNEPGRFAVFLDEQHVRVHVNKRYIARVEGL